MIKLYGAARSRATIVRWYLEELNLEYEEINLDMQAGEHRQPAYLEINPMGKVPAIVDGELKLWESGAILLYLADQYGQPQQTPAERAIAAQWVLFANATLGPGIFIEANREREMPKLMGALNGILSQQPYLTGEEFTVADVAVGSYLSYIPLMLQLDLSGYPAVENYMKTIAARPAFQKAFANRG